MADPVSFVVAEWTLSGVIGGLYRVLSEIHRLIVTAPREQEANAALAAELDKLMLLCGSKVHEFRSRAVYQAPGAVDALGYVEAQVKAQQTVLEQAAKDERIWSRWRTRDAEKLLKDVHDELCKAFAVGLITATTEMQVVMLQNQASQGATLDAASGGVARLLDLQGNQGPKIDNTLRTVVSIHTLLETIHKNLGNISATTDGSPQEQHAAAVNAVTQPLQQDGAEPREEEFKIMYKVLENLLDVRTSQLLDPTSMDLMVDPVTCTDRRTHCRWEAFKIMDSLHNNMPGCPPGGFKVVQDNADLRSELFGEHPAQQTECARRRREYLTEVESLIVGATNCRADYDLAEKHTQRALQWMHEGSAEHRALQQQLKNAYKALTEPEPNTESTVDTPPPTPTSSSTATRDNIYGPAARDLPGTGGSLGSDRSVGSTGNPSSSRPPNPLAPGAEQYYRDIAAQSLVMLQGRDPGAAKQVTATIASMNDTQTLLRAALVEAGAVPLLSSALVAAVACDVEHSIAAARALTVLGTGGLRCRADVVAALVHLLQADGLDEGLRREAWAASAAALQVAVCDNPEAAAAAAGRDATPLLAKLIDSGMHDDLCAPSLAALAALAAAGQACGVAVEVLNRANFISQNNILQVLGYGPAAVAATASLIGALAADGSPDIVRALLQRDAAVLLTRMLQCPREVGGAREADVANLQCKGMAALEALAAAGGGAQALLPAALAGLAALQPEVAASAAKVVELLAGDPAFPQAAAEAAVLQSTDGARSLVLALRLAGAGPGSALATAIAAAAQTHPAAREALAHADASAAPAPPGRRGRRQLFCGGALPAPAAAPRRPPAPLQHGPGHASPAAHPVAHWVQPPPHPMFY